MKKFVEPKRVGTHVVNYFRHGLAIRDRHPVYEYRGYYIARASGVASGSSYYYEIYAGFENGKPSGFDFHLNCDQGFRRLYGAVGTIDYSLSES